MSGPGVFGGLARSAFLADVDDRDRDAGNIARAVAGGLGVGLVSAIACWIVILAPYALLAGRGSEGLEGIGRIAAGMADLRIGDPTTTFLRLLVATATDGLFLIAFVAVAAAVARRGLHRYVTVAPRIRWRLLLLGLALAALALGPLVVTDRLATGNVERLPLMAISPGVPGRVFYALSALLLIPAAAAEELFFRGWLLRQTAAFTRRPAVLIAFGALVFSALHFDFTPDAFLTRAIMGAGFAYMTLRLGGIEFSTGVHAANNMLIVLFVQPLTAQVGADTTGVTAGALVEDMALVAGYLAMTEAVVRIAALRRWAGVRPEEISPPGLGEPHFS
ncbi:MAG: CPBP family intramembrane glutamic endopeptidase [Caulobacteraceae bacterium]